MNFANAWRSRLCRDITWLLLAKLGLLTVLWVLFFSGPHQCRVDGFAAANHLALMESAAAGECGD